VPETVACTFSRGTSANHLEGSLPASHEHHDPAGPTVGGSVCTATKEANTRKPAVTNTRRAAKALLVLLGLASMMSACPAPADRLLASEAGCVYNGQCHRQRKAAAGSHTNVEQDQ